MIYNDVKNFVHRSPRSPCWDAQEDVLCPFNWSEISRNMIEIHGCKHTTGTSTKRVPSSCNGNGDSVCKIINFKGDPEISLR